MSNESKEMAMLHACETADEVIQYLLDEGLVNHRNLYDESRIATEEDPEGFTEAGRDLFEMIYNSVLGRFE